VEEEDPTPPIAPQMPTARLRAGPSSNVVVRIESEAGAMIAPPRPCAARAAISSVCVSANPPASEASANSTRPEMNTRRRPSRSAARPPSSRKPANVTVYALTTHCRSCSEKRSELRMAGSATFTTDTSRTTMNWARQASTRMARRWEWPVFSGVWGVL